MRLNSNLLRVALSRNTSRAFGKVYIKSKKISFLTHRVYTGCLEYAT